MSIINNDPLTIDELHEMDGKPVWIENLENPEKSQWRLCHWDRGKYLVLQGISIQGYLLEDYGVSWIAFESEPFHIDLSKWGECTSCHKCSSCRYSIEGNANDPVTPCYECSNFNNYTPRNFCPDCGRPLTKEGKQMLERMILKLNKHRGIHI